MYGILSADDLVKRGLAAVGCREPRLGTGRPPCLPGPGLFSCPGIAGTARATLPRRSLAITGRAHPCHDPATHSSARGCRGLLRLVRGAPPLLVEVGAATLAGSARPAPWGGRLSASIPDPRRDLSGICHSPADPGRGPVEELDPAVRLLVHRSTPRGLGSDVPLPFLAWARAAPGAGARADIYLPGLADRLERGPGSSTRAVPSPRCSATAGLRITLARAPDGRNRPRSWPTAWARADLTPLQLLFTAYDDELSPSTGPALLEDRFYIGGGCRSSTALRAGGRIPWRRSCDLPPRGGGHASWTTCRGPS